MSSLELMNLESLKIIAFWKIVENGCVEILDKNYRFGKKYSLNEISALDECWKNLYDEFYEYRQNKSGKYTITKNFELIKLSLMLELLTDIENRLILLINLMKLRELDKFIVKRTNEVVTDFKSLYPKVKIAMFADCYEILTIVQSVIKAQTNIFDEKAGAKQNTIKKQKETIFDVVSLMSKQLGYGLDVNNMSCMEFIGHENTINSTLKSNNVNIK
jgi:hypothetical protein